MSKKEYFIEKDGNKQGAFTFEELIKLDIYDDTNIWKAGWEDWKKASEVKELEQYVILKPPPTKQEKVHIDKQEKLSSYVNRIKINSPKYLKGFFVVTLAWNFIYFIIAQDGGSSLYPIYLSAQEQRNPGLIFWNMLPFHAMIFGIGASLLLMIKSYTDVNSGVNMTAAEPRQINSTFLPIELKKVPYIKEIPYSDYMFSWILFLLCFVLSLNFFMNGYSGVVQFSIILGIVNFYFINNNGKAKKLKIVLSYLIAIWLLLGLHGILDEAFRQSPNVFSLDFLHLWCRIITGLIIIKILLRNHQESKAEWNVEESKSNTIS